MDKIVCKMVNFVVIGCLIKFKLTIETSVSTGLTQKEYVHK